MIYRRSSSAAKRVPEAGPAAAGGSEAGASPPSSSENSTVSNHEKARHLLDLIEGREPRLPGAPGESLEAMRAWAAEVVRAVEGNRGGSPAGAASAPPDREVSGNDRSGGSGRDGGGADALSGELFSAPFRRPGAAPPPPVSPSEREGGLAPSSAGGEGRATGGAALPEKTGPADGGFPRPSGPFRRTDPFTPSTRRASAAEWDRATPPRDRRLSSGHGGTQVVVDHLWTRDAVESEARRLARRSLGDEHHAIIALRVRRSPSCERTAILERLSPARASAVRRTLSRL
jgi:hypothetical protein